MKKLFSFIALSLFVFLTAFYYVPQSVLADGMIIRPTPYDNRWDYLGESNQQVFINYDNGLQKMIVSVGFEEENSGNAVWIFPVPSDPEKVVIDVVKSFPQLGGEEISKKAKSNLDDATEFLQMTQIYTIPFVSFDGMNTKMAANIYSNEIDSGFGGSVVQDIVVYEHLEKEGITSEIITAKTAAGLYDYLKNKGLKIEAGEIPILNNYIGKDFSFVVSWIVYSEQNALTQKITDTIKILEAGGEISFEDRIELENAIRSIDDYNIFDQWQKVVNSTTPQSATGELNNLLALLESSNKLSSMLNQRGVFVTFPTKEIYFPMLPTSVYESKIVPATIRVIGYVSPELFQDIKSYTKVEYYIDDYAVFSDELKPFYNGEEQNIKYTKIEINAPSKFLTDDLWIDKQAPIKTYYSTFIVNHPIISAIILFILSSMVAGILVGLVIFRELRRNVVKLGLIGLSNCLSIMGLLITTALVSTRNKDDSANSLLAEIKQKGYFWKRGVALVLFFLAIPFLAFGLFALPLLISQFSYYGQPGYYGAYIDSGVYYLILVAYVLPILALVVGFIIKRIKPNDRYLFDELRSLDYSSWSFYPKDKMKIAFVPIFSVSFLIISWLLVEFVKLII